MNMNLPYLLHNNGVKEIITIGAESMHTILELALKGNPSPALQAELLTIKLAIEKAWEPKNDDDDYDWEH